jgi:hypothetical protein
MFKQQTIRKDADTVVEIIGEDTTVTVYPGVDNYGVIYAATYGRGIIRLDEFQKPVGIYNPGGSTGSGPDFKVYPNPATDHARIEFTLTDASKVSMSMYNLSGRLVKSIDLGELTTGNHEINLSVRDYPSGTYILRINTGNKSSSGKIIIY